jgi:hypothetical protein
MSMRNSGLLSLGIYAVIMPMQFMAFLVYRNRYYLQVDLQTDEIAELLTRIQGARVHVNPSESQVRIIFVLTVLSRM